MTLIQNGHPFCDKLNFSFPTYTALLKPEEEEIWTLGYWKEQILYYSEASNPLMVIEYCKMISYNVFTAWMKKDKIHYTRDFSVGFSLALMMETVCF